MTRARRRGAGFSVVELLISMVIFSLLVAGMSSVVLTSGRMQRRSERIHVTQGSARAAIELMSRDVRMASAGASSGVIARGSKCLAPPPLAIVVTDSATGPDRLDLLTIDATAQAQTLAPFDGTPPQLEVSSASTFAPGDVVQVGDLSAATLLLVTHVHLLARGARLKVFPLAQPMPHYDAGSYVLRARAVSYFVDSTLFGPGDPLLMMDPDGAGPAPAQPLAEGVEDFQVALGFDWDGDGVVREVGLAAGDDEWVFNVPGERAPASLVGLKSVRVTVVARTVTPEGADLFQRPVAEDHAASPVADGYPRRVAHSEIAVRSFNL